MNDQEIQSFLRGQFKVECFRIELSREGEHPLSVSGPGVIEQDDNYILNYRIHIDADSVKALLDEINRPQEVGKIIPREDYFQFTAFSYSLPIWNAEIAGLGCSPAFGQGGIAYGRISEMSLINDQLPKECTKDYARLWIREAVEFPMTGVTETEVKRSGKTHRKNSSLDYAEFKVGDEDFQLYSKDSGVELSCTFEKEGINKNKHVRIQEAMQFALGQPFQPCAIKLTSGTSELTILRSTSFRGNRQVRQDPPLIFRGKLPNPSVYEIAKAFYTKICCHDGEGWHPVSSHVYYLLQAGSAALELQCLALGVAAEGIADTCHASLAPVTEAFKQEIDEAMSKVEDLDLTETLGNRIKGAMGSMKNPRGSDRIRAFVEQNTIKHEVFKSWKRVRNAAAHGGKLESKSIPQTLQDLNNVLHLSYAMILDYIGYDGDRTDYSANGFPPISPKNLKHNN